MDAFNFQEPGDINREYINPEQLLGKLIIVWPIQYVKPAPPTKFSRPDKVDDAISVDVVTLDILDDTGQPKVFRSQLWRQGRLIQAFRAAAPQKPLLGTLGKGQATMGNPPWQFISLTHEPAAVERANAWAAVNPDFKPSEPREYTVTAPVQQQAPQQYQQQQYQQQPQYGYQQQGWTGPSAAYAANMVQNPPPLLQQPHWHGAPQDMPQWAQQPQQAPQQPQTPPLPPQQAGPAQQSILERLAQQHANNPMLEGEQARQQYGY